MKEQYKILAVDDEKFNLLLLKSCLKNENFQLTSCTDAIDALQEFKKDDFDLVLLDIMMRGIDGFEVRKLIRELNKQVPIIFLTSLVDDLNSTLLVKISDDPYTYYLNKSFDKQSLLKKINQAITAYRDQMAADQYYHKLEADLTLAGEVQKIMLPTWATLNDQIISSYLYAPGVKVSGDIFEMVALSPQHYLCLIGDISGHGIQAALYMSAIQSYLKVLLAAAASPDLLEPHDILNQINSFFNNDLNGENYMTCLVAIFDFQHNLLRYQSAGHPGIICCTAAHDDSWMIEDNGRGGIPIGWRRNYIYDAADNVEYHFSDDTIFMFYTDGILDLRNAADELAGESNFRMLVGPLPSECDVVTLPFRLRYALSQIGYNLPTDDICLVALQKNVPSANIMYRVITPDTALVSTTAAEFADFLRQRFDLYDLSVKIELLLSEFPNNIIIHGLESHKHNQSAIVIRMELLSDEVLIKVMDRGKIWNYTPTYSDSASFLEMQNQMMATSGRGMAIIHSIANSISRNHYCGLNTTIFSILTTQQVEQ